MIRDGPLIFLGEGGGVRQFFWARFFFSSASCTRFLRFFASFFEISPMASLARFLFQPFFSVQEFFLEISQPLPPPLGPQKNHGSSLNSLCFKLTGSQFWRGSRKILVAKKSQRSYLRRGRGQKKKPTTGDILDRLRKMVSSDAEEEDDFTETPSPEPKQSAVQLQGKSSSSSTQENVEENVAKMLQSIFKCTICLNQCELPAAACSTCYAVIGCVHCLEQWIETGDSLAKCPLCRTTANYAVIPVVREIANILVQSVSRSNIVVENDASDTDTIPYGIGNEEHHSDEDFDLAPVL